MTIEQIVEISQSKDKVGHIRSIVGKISEEDILSLLVSILPNRVILQVLREINEKKGIKDYSTNLSLIEEILYQTNMMRIILVDNIS